MSGGVDWETLVTGAEVVPVRRGWMAVTREAPVIRIWWEVWTWRADVGAQALDVSVSYEDAEESEDSDGYRRTLRLLRGLTLLSGELAPGHWRQDVTEVSHRTSVRGWHGRVRTYFREDNLELLGSLERGLMELKATGGR